MIFFSIQKKTRYNHILQLFSLQVSRFGTHSNFEREQEKNENNKRMMTKFDAFFFKQHQRGF
jgi:hypothetical protein